MPKPPEANPSTGANRFSQNILRLPARTIESVRRTFDPQYRLQIQANLTVPLWLSASLRAEIYSVPGTSSRRELLLLASLARRAPTGGVFVEIGAFKGRSTALLVEVAHRRPASAGAPPTVVSIDPHMRNTWETFQVTLQRFHLLNRGLEVHRAFSHDIGASWSRPISFLWVDGSHEYPDVLHDIADFTPHLLPNAHVIFDDAGGGHFPGVEKALTEWDHNAAGFRDLGTIKRCRIYQRLPA